MVVFEPSLATRLITVGKIVTGITISAPSSVGEGELFTVSGDLRSIIPAEPLAGKEVAILYNGTFLDSGFTDVNGHYSIPVRIPVFGSYRLFAEFRGDVEYEGSSASVPITVTELIITTSLTIVAPDIIAVNEFFDVTGILTRDDTGAGLRGMTVNLYYNTTLLGSGVTDFSGAYSIPASIPTAGTYMLKAEFTGVSGLARSVAVRTVRVGLAPMLISTLGPLTTGLALIIAQAIA